MSTDNESEVIRQKMHKLRRRLDQEATQWTSDAHRWLDWKHYVGQYPLVSVGLAAVAGYLLIPGKSKPTELRLDEMSRSELLKQFGSLGKAAVPPQPSLLSSAINLTTNMLIRAAIAYAGQQVGKVMGHEAANSENSSTGTETGTGDHSPNTPVPFGVFDGDRSIHRMA